MVDGNNLNEQNTLTRIGIRGDAIISYENNSAIPVETLTFVPSLEVSRRASIEQPNQSPVANAGEDISSREFTQVNIDGTQSFDPDTGDSLTYEWTQISGTTALLFQTDTPNLILAAPNVGANGDTLVFELRVTDQNGAFSVDTVNLFVRDSSTNTAPTASASGPMSVDENALVQLDATGSVDPDGDQITFSWVQTAGTPVVLLDETSATPTFTAPTNGSENLVFELTVSDGLLQSTSQVTVAVTDINFSPVSDPLTIIGNEDSEIMGNLTATDNDGDDLTFALAEMGDPDDGSLIINDDGSFIYTPDADFVGTDSFIFTVTDGIETITRTETIIVNPINDAPSFTVGADQSVFENSGMQTVDGFITMISAGPSDEIDQGLSFTVNTNNDSLFLEGPAIDATGTLTYTLANEATGTATIIVELRDDGGTADGGVDFSEIQTFDITVFALNSTPIVTGLLAPLDVLEDDSPVMLSDSIEITDPDGDDQTLTITVVGGSVSFSNTIGLMFSPMGGANNSSNVIVSGTLEALNNALDGLTFTPTADQNGTDSASITIVSNDGAVDGIAANTTFDVTAVNDAPSFTVGTDQTVDEDAGAQIVTGFASGISAGPANESEQTLTFTLSTDDNDLFAVGPAIDAAGTLTYTLADNVNGDITVSVSLADDGGVANNGVDTSASQIFTIAVNPVNDAPTITGLPAGIVLLENSVNDFDLSSIMLADIENDALTLTLEIDAGTFSVPQDGAGNGVNATLVNDTTITLEGSAGNINAYLDTTSNIQFTTVSEASDGTSATLTASVSDGDEMMSQTTTIDFTSDTDIAQNEPPVANAGADITSFEFLQINIDGTQSTDIDFNDSLTFEWTQISGTEALFFGSDTPTLILAAPNVDIGGDTLVFELRVTDLSGASSTDRVNVFIRDISENTSPISEASGPMSVDENSSVQLSAEGSFDPDGSPVTFEWVQTAGTPVTLVGADTGTPTFTAPSNGSEDLVFELIISDGLSQTSSEVTVAVNPVNIAPTPMPLSLSGNEDIDIMNRLTATDIDGDDLTFALVEMLGPDNGTVLINADGSFTYTPDANFNGNDSFTFSVTDGIETVTENVEITINAINDAPTIIGLPEDIPFGDNAITNVDLSQTIIADVDNDEISVELSASSGILTAINDDNVIIEGSNTNSIILTGTTEAINTFLGTPTNIQHTQDNSSNGNTPVTIFITVSDDLFASTQSSINLNTVDAPIVNNFETPSLVVTTTEDIIDQLDNETSLREAIAFANSTSNANTITFASNTGEAFEGDTIIRLTQGVLEISSDLTIDGSSADGEIIITGDALGDDALLADSNITDVQNNVNTTDNSRVFIVTSGISSTLNDLTITGGVNTSGAGGAIFAADTNSVLNINNTTLSGNSAAASNGGAIAATTTILTNSTISHNLANSGGGVYALDATLINATLSGNSALYGGGVHTPGSLSLTNTTVSGNNANFGGGINANNVTLTNSIILGNSAATADAISPLTTGTEGAEIRLFNINPSLIANGQNIVGDDTSAFDATDIDGIINADPTEIFAVTDGNFIDNTVLSGSLADNGGPVETIALLAGGIADNAGILSASTPDFDARGVLRIIDDGVDLGAFEITDNLVTTGNDNISGTNNDETIIGFAGNDTINGLGGDDTLNGLSDNDLIFGGEGDDLIAGSSGNDTIDGGTGSDTLNGSIDDDLVLGNNGNDLISGSFGNDSLSGGDGTDTLFGGGQNDILDGDNDDDILHGENGFDSLRGGAGDDVLNGGNNADLLNGGTDNDILNGENGRDRLLGASGNDELNGGQNNDNLIGGSGFDTLNGGTGNDTLSGNFNADFFVFEDGFGNDVLIDFDQANAFEKINLTAVTNIDNFNDLIVNHLTEDNDGNAVISDGANTITLLNIDMNDLEESDFIF